MRANSVITVRPAIHPKVGRPPILTITFPPSNLKVNMLMLNVSNVISTMCSKAHPLLAPPAMPTQASMPACSARIAHPATIHPTGIKPVSICHTRNRLLMKAEAASITVEPPAVNATRLRCAKLPVLPAMTATILAAAISN